MFTSAVRKQQNRMSPRLPFLLMLLAASLSCCAQAAPLDAFNDDECNFNPMRKPPRFGKRSHSVADLTGGQDDQLPLGVDPAAWPQPSEDTSGGPRPRRSNCIRGPLRRRTLRGSPTDFGLAAGVGHHHLKTAENLKRLLKLTEEGESGNEIGEATENSGGVNPVESYLLEKAKVGEQESENSAGGSVGSGNGNSGSSHRLTDDLLLIARLRARFPKAMRSLEAVVREFKALDSRSSGAAFHARGVHRAAVDV